MRLKSADWAEAGKQALIDGVAGAAGGGVALGLAKLALSAGGGAAQRLGSLMSSSARSSLTAGVQGAVTNTATYGTDPDIAKKTAAGYLGSAVTGFGFGAGGSAGAGKISGAVLSRMGSASSVAMSAGRHADTSNGAVTSDIVAGFFNHLSGGVGSVLNESIRQGGDLSNEKLLEVLGKGFLLGAQGPTRSLHGAQ